MIQNLAALWKHLQSVSTLTFEAKSRLAETGWNGSGQGSVVVKQADQLTLLFDESGTWTAPNGKALTFTNTFRWTSIPEGDAVRLEHLRFGENHPVYLFDLAPVDTFHWQSTEPHVCREDLYQATLRYGSDGLSLHWTINGPTKDEEITYLYR